MARIIAESYRPQRNVAASGGPETAGSCAGNGAPRTRPIEVSGRQIIDGRNRYRACLELGIKPRLAEWDGTGSRWRSWPPASTSTAAT